MFKTNEKFRALRREIETIVKSQIEILQIKNMICKINFSLKFLNS
jgi:hypothetical protein